MSGPGSDGSSDDDEGEYHETSDETPPAASDEHHPTESHTDDSDADSDAESDADGADRPTAGDDAADPSTAGRGAEREQPDRTARGQPDRVESGPLDSDEPSPASSGSKVTIEDDGVVRWFLKTDNGTVVAVRDIASSIAIVAVIGLLLFGISGIWPPLVAVESGSMEPNMHKGDLIFVVDDDRFVGDDPVDGTGVVTMTDGERSGHDKFGKPGDVVIFMPNGNEFETPVIHRAHFWVEEGDDWVAEANPDYVGGQSCDQIATCPAAHDGFITKGDNNGGYDQLDRSGAHTDVVQAEWVTGKAMYRIPWLGHVRLTFDQLLATGVLGTSGLAAGVFAVADRRRRSRRTS